MAKVYTVTVGEYEDAHVFGVFSTPEKAKSWVTKEREKTRRTHRRMQDAPMVEDIEEFELDELLKPATGTE